MLCFDCKVVMKRIRTDYPYRESGLDNVILKRIPAYRCPKCREVSPVITNVKGLHSDLAQRLISKTSALSGKELVFLRKEMRMKAKELAAILGVNKVTVSRWENDKEKISPPSDRLIRILYKAKVIEEKCAMARPEIEKLRSRSAKIARIEDLLNSSCSLVTQTELTFKAIKNREIQSPVIFIQP